jgi:tetratricopeptide (TPR) repeat protein
MNSPRLEALLKFLEEDPTDSFTRYAIALEYASAQNVPEAIIKMQELLVVDQGYVPAYHQLGSYLGQLGRTNEAIDILEQGIQRAAHAGDRHAQGEMQELIDELEESHHP